MEEEEEILGNNGGGISVSLFDDSVENHFKAMDIIAKLCGEGADPVADSSDEPQIQPLYSSITFLREWRNFNYKPRTVRFACETGSSEEKDVLSGISLPQFSSATVPQTDGLNRDIASAELSKDFIMYVGGSVWALDWCPRAHNSDIKCEFVAVAAHPPESYYHKIGALLTGRGIVQIWCILNVDGSKEEALPLAKKQKQAGEYNKAHKEKSTEVKKPRGRPRKNPIESPFDGEASKDSTQIKRPRGRPRKKPVGECPDGLDCNNQYVQALSIQYPEDSSGLIGVEGVPKNTQEQCITRRKDHKQKSSIKAFSACNSVCKTAKQKRKSESKAMPLTASDDVVCLPLLTQNEEASSAMNNQIHDNSGQTPAMFNCFSSDVSLDTNSASSLIPKEVALPRVVFCLAHNGKVAWDIKWQPCNATDARCQHRMGYLAVLLGNGSLEVWDVPLPHRIKSIYYSSCKEGTDPRFVKLEPVFKCSNLKCGDVQSIPLTVEWSTSRFHDYLLAGCHDGMVALWKFSTTGASVDTRPLLCFSADANPIRSVAWAPLESDQESRNIILTAGQLNVKFWDIRDPFRPLWDIHLAPKFVYSVDWLPDPRCIIVSCDDGTVRLFSLVKVAYDSPFNGKLPSGTKQGMHVFNSSSSFAIWSIQVSRLTGMVAYCSADGTVHRFQLTTNAVEKDPSRNRAPHFMCGSLGGNESAVVVNTPSQVTPSTVKNPGKDNAENLRSVQGLLSKSNQAKRMKEKKAEVSDSENQVLAICYGNDPGMETEPEETLASLAHKSKQKSKKKNQKKHQEDEASVFRDEEQEDLFEKENGKEMGNQIEFLPPKIVAMHRVRWNMNKGSERWLCSGGAAGVVRCQEIIMSDLDKKLAKKR